MNLTGGINALPAAMELAAKYNVEMPIVQTVNAIVKEGIRLVKARCRPYLEKRWEVEKK